MKWISVKEALPEKSGRYLAAVKRKGYHSNGVVQDYYYYAILPYSKVHNQWNNFDDLDKDAEDYFKDVLFWSEIDEPEVDK